MRLNEAMALKGIKVHPGYSAATDGGHRSGQIRKEMVLENGKNEKRSLIGIVIDTYEMTIDVLFLNGPNPKVENLLMALLSDRDIRRLIREYQDSKPTGLFEVWEKKSASGRRTIFVTYAEKRNGFAITKTRQLADISCVGKCKYEIENMFIGDFVMLLFFLGLTKETSVGALRKMAKARYVMPRLAEELEEFKMEISKIL